MDLTFEEFRDCLEAMEPTDARPGSEEKLAVMERRYALGQPVFHPDDARDEYDRTPASTPMSGRVHSAPHKNRYRYLGG